MPGKKRQRPLSVSAVVFGHKTPRNRLKTIVCLAGLLFLIFLKFTAYMEYSSTARAAKRKHAPGQVQLRTCSPLLFLKPLTLKLRTGLAARDLQDSPSTSGCHLHHRSLRKRIVFPDNTDKFVACICPLSSKPGPPGRGAPRKPVDGGYRFSSLRQSLPKPSPRLAAGNGRR